MNKARKFLLQKNHQKKRDRRQLAIFLAVLHADFFEEIKKKNKLIYFYAPQTQHSHLVKCRWKREPAYLGYTKIILVTPSRVSMSCKSERKRGRKKIKIIHNNFLFSLSLPLYPKKIVCIFMCRSRMYLCVQFFFYIASTYISIVPKKVQ